ncbi:MAG: NAD(P)H-dependent oxidoreductase [Clostridiales Family XIII bacterium]|jgi:chromate reductase|nr:NAD(P)H-dependent oxidoreductase [Clostridiales Family XIII bacterium]
MNILVIVGGISKKSINKKLFELIKPLSPKDFEFDSYDISLLPFYSQDIESNLPGTVIEFKNKVFACDAVIFVTPEYNRSIPGVLKNAVDWCSRPYGASLWNKKPSAVLGASMGPIGAFAAQTDLKKLLSFLDSFVMYQPEIYLNFAAYVDQKGEFLESTKKLYEKFLSSFKEHILKINRFTVLK